MPVQRLLRLVEELRERAVALEAAHHEDLDRVAPDARASARNLLHYLSFRQEDLRPLQAELAELGLSSLDGAEAHVLACLDRVAGALARISGHELPHLEAPVDHGHGPRLLVRNTERLLGSARGRAVRIMVTMPSEAGTSYELVRDMVAAGMDIMRINCAHDDASCWAAMTANLRRASAETGHKCRVEVDLAGPKIRTGRLDPVPGIRRFKPKRHHRGEVTEPALITLYRDDQTPPPTPAGALPITGELLAHAAPGDRIGLCDVRGRVRALEIVKRMDGSVLAHAHHGVWVEAGTILTLVRDSEVLAQGSVGALPAAEVPLVLRAGDRLRVLPPHAGAAAGDSTPAVTCTAPEVFADLRPGESIWFDDGKIGGVIESASKDGLVVQITFTKPGGDRLASDKGINLPDSTLTLPALTAKDLADLDFAAAEADLVALSFLHEPGDLIRLERELDLRSAPPQLGIVLKIETRRAFENLPRLLLTALASPPVGVMIARGDLAVEVGFERLAEVQEEILWLCEAAHVPVIWATQVLETLAKTGRPSRAEVTDAAMAVRAESVMLNKGPHVVEAVRFLDDVLRRMGEHQHKKRQLLRRLKVSAF